MVVVLLQLFVYGFLTERRNFSSCDDEFLFFLFFSVSIHLFNLVPPYCITTTTHLVSLKYPRRCN